MRLLTTSLMTALLLAACSDDSTPTKTPDKTIVNPDKGAPLEASTVDKSTVDKSTVSEQKAATEAGGAKWTCKQIGECAKPCGTDVTVCVPACTAKGCPTAQTKFGALSQCAVAKCLASCVGGFNDACNDCSKVQCKTEYDACEGDVCP